MPCARMAGITLRPTDPMTAPFRSPVMPHQMLLSAAFPTQFGSKPITYAEKSRQNDGLQFGGLFTCVFTTADQVKSQMAPADFRTMIETHIDAK